MAQIWFATPASERSGIAAAQRCDASAKAQLIRLTQGTNEPVYWRAVAAGLLWQWSEEPDTQAALFECFD